MHITIVGVCAAGKTTLAQKLQQDGYDAETVAQEHSYVAALYRHTPHDVLIFLDASLAAIKKRREIDWGEEQLAAEYQRLAEARRACDLYIKTDDLNAERVFRRVRRFLEKRAHEIGRAAPDNSR